MKLALSILFYLLGCASICYAGVINNKVKHWIVCTIAAMGVLSLGFGCYFLLITKI